MGSGLITLQEPPGRRRTYQTTDDGGQRTDEPFCPPSSVFGRPNEAKLVLQGEEDREPRTERLCPPSSVLRRPTRALAIRAIKPVERLVPVSFARRRASTSGLSTWWSSTALKGELVLRLVSRLDAFSGYPFRI